MLGGAPKSGRGALLALAVLAAGCSHVVVKSRTTTYPVHAEDFDELELTIHGQRPNSLSALGPWTIASMTYRIGYALKWRAVGGVCRSSGLRVELHLEMLLPRWATPDGSQPNIDTASRLKWKRLLASTREHERGHGRIARRASREFLRLLLDHRSGTCAEADDWVRVAREDLRVELGKRQSDFESASRHPEHPRSIGSDGPGRLPLASQ